MKQPLAGLVVLEFSQYLAGPYAGLRLADLGARVIKIERPKWGDACRQLATKNLRVDNDSVLFHTINRNKESYAANLKDADDLEKVKQLISKADVITHNFRPGIMERIGLDYASVKAINPTIVYGEVSGYGKVGPWKDKPGQDLLAQSFSGLTWVSADRAAPPTPFGVAVADMMCGTHLAQGLLAALVRKKRHGIGAKVEVSLMESILDLQFEGLTHFFNNGQQLPTRSETANAHPYLEAPYGIYPTQDGHIAIAMGSLDKLGQLIGLDSLAEYEASNTSFEKRDEIKNIIAAHLKSQTTAHWLALLEPADYWCSDVFDYDKLTSSEVYQLLQMEQKVSRGNNVSVTTTRCPIRINQSRLTSNVAAPVLGNANDYLFEELGL
ncbi:CaiB/BaiF CoA transferase family protein [Echinimonas agarilytica]|uniref:CoA transferase n=1 Tax=Echinimonas agarilytica TaxID=1215918 RepID=A0AA41W6X9_9GAMM|nr:CaiB/BaiF CoA-transferase family protein [Echinimonas agarilytica]MCM2679711.1 CoA transferase [Echinimonas agarilytica]